MSETELDPLADRLQENLEKQRTDDALSQAFFAVGYIQAGTDDETQEALTVLADVLKEVRREQ